jgi:hypothetical protein
MVTADLAADLRERIAAKQLICVVGAGVAAASVRPGAGSEVALWPGLVESGVRWVHALHPELPAHWVDDRLRALASDDIDDLLSVASQVASKLGAPAGGEYAEWLHRSAGALELGDPSLIEALGALDVPIVTTNYDHLLEQVLHRDAVSWRDEAAVDRILRGDSSAILHLHGHCSQPASVVLGLWEYAGLVDNEHTQAVMHALGLAKSLLFVGFGAGLRDPNFRQFLRWMRRVSWTMPYRHYRLARAQDAAPLRLEHDPAERVMVLPYGDRFEDLAPFLRGLAPREPAAPLPAPVEKTSATLIPTPVPELSRWDELASLEHELDERMVGEFTLLEVLVTGAAEHADWSKRSARNLMTTLARTAANLVDGKELDDVYGWLLVYGVLRFTSIDRWWRKKRDWQHSVDLTELAPRGKQLLNRLAAK